jgi:hypothetical protein
MENRCGPAGMSAGQEPEGLAGVGEGELEKPAGGFEMRRAAEDGDSVGIHRREIGRQHETEVGPARGGDLGEGVEIHGQGVGRFAERGVLGGGGGDPVEASGVAPEPGQELPAGFPAAGLEERFEHDVHGAAAPGVAGPHPAEQLGPREILPAIHARQAGESLDPQILQDPETGDRRPVPGEVGRAEFDAGDVRRQPFENRRGNRPRLRHPLGREFVVRLLAAPEEQVDPDAFGLPRILRLHEARPTRRSPPTTRQSMSTGSPWRSWCQREKPRSNSRRGWPRCAAR